MKQVTLSECLDLVIDRRGLTPKKLNTTWKVSGYRVLSANNVKSNGLINENSIRYVDKETYLRWMKEPLKKGDILLTSEAPAGEVFYWDSDEEIVVGQRLYGLRVKKTVDPLYLKYYLQSKYGKFQIQRNCTGSTVLGISIRTFDLIQILLPDFEIQKRIGRLLYDLDRKIANNSLIVSQLEKIKQYTFQYWFLQYEFPSVNSRPYKSSGGKMKFNKTLNREIPEEWSVSRLGKYLDPERGISYSSGDLEGQGIPMINLNSFNIDSTYKESGLKLYSGNYAQKKQIKAYDLIVCATQQTAIDLVNDTDVIGKSFIMPDIFESDIVMSMDVIKFNVDEHYSKYYLDMLFKQKFFHNYITGFANGTKIKHLNIEGILNYETEVPPPNILKKFDDFAYDIEKQKSIIIKENRELYFIREFLMPMLISGQLSFK